MVHIAGLGHTHYRVQEQYPVDFLDCPLGEFFVDPVQWIAGLERDHIVTAEARQSLPHLRRSEAQVLEIVVARQLQDLKPSRDVKLAPPVHLRDQWVA